jgi:ribosomal protein L35AE/L33A
MLDLKELKTTIERRLMNNTEIYRVKFYTQMKVKTAGTEVEPMLYHSNYETEGILREATRK